MSDDDYILALQTSVKIEVVEHYLGERRIIQEEMQLVYEAASAYHGGLCRWDKECRRLARALITPQTAERFFRLAGLDQAPPPLPAGFARPRGLTNLGRYTRLVEGLYRDLWQMNQDLRQEREQVLSLMEEVNQDVRRFETNYDLLAITSYLRSLDPQELRRRKVLGGNFSASEIAASLANLSFKPITPLALDIAQPPPGLKPPSQVMPAARTILKELVREEGRRIEELWSGPAPEGDGEDACRLE